MTVPGGRNVWLLNENRFTDGLYREGFDFAYERLSRALWLQLARNAHTVLDLGAQSGVYALLAHAVQPQARVLALEGSPVTFLGLRRNSIINNHAIRALNYAVTNQNGTVDFSQSSMVDGKNPGASARYQVPGITIAQLMREEGLEGIDLMKIDVEQHEAEVLEGMGQYLATLQPNLLIEVLTPEMADALNPFFEGLDYRFLNIDDTHGVAYERPRIEKSYVYNNLAVRPAVLEQLKASELPIR